jgi:hypothetical protein
MDWTLAARILTVMSVLLAGCIVAISRRRRGVPRGMVRNLYLVAGFLFFSSLPDAVPLPHAGKIVSLVIQVIVVLAIFRNAWKMAEKSS